MSRLMSTLRQPAFIAGLLVVALTLPAMLALLWQGDYWVSHDGLFHLYRLVGLEQAWRQGYWYPRIFPEFAFGYGFSVLNFYGPLTYYVALFGHLLGLSAITAMKLTYAISYPLAALGMWVLAREVWGKDGKAHEGAGLLAAVVYTYVPYHLADVQLRGALAESWAFVWWGWLLWAAWRGRFTTFALTLAALVLTHNLSVILIAIPLAVWCAIALARTPDKRLYIMGMGAATLAAMTISAFYWLPVLLESRYVQISQDVGGLGFASHLHPITQWVAATATYLYFPNQQVAAEHPLSWAQMALLVVALLCGLWSARQQKALWFFGWLTLAATLILLTPASYPLWERLVFPFGLIQYPWRWLGITALASALMVGGAVVALPRRVAWGVYPLMGLLVLWLAWSGLAQLPYEAQPVELARYPAPMWEADAANGQVGATWTAEFLPLTVREQRWALARAPETVQNVGEETPARVLSAEGDAWNLTLSVDSFSDAVISVPRFAYPSMAVWQSNREGDPATRSLPIVPRGDLGIAGVSVGTSQSGLAEQNLSAGTLLLDFDLYPLAAPPFLNLGLSILAIGTLAVIALRQGQRGLITFMAVGAMLVLFIGFGTRPIYYQSLENGVATLGNQAQLVAWQHREGRVGQPLPVTLLWFNLRQSDQNYVTYLHLTPLEGGAPLAQHDSQPNLGTLPTTRWLAGQVVEDFHLIDLPPDLPAGQYTLWAGMYAVQDGQAVPLEGDSGERRELGEIEVIR